MEKKGWKILAWILIVLIILETTLFSILFFMGLSIMNSEKECANNICEDNISDAYYYDTSTSTCYCYKNSQVIKKLYLD